MAVARCWQWGATGLASEGRGWGYPMLTQGNLAGSKAPGHGMQLRLTVIYVVPWENILEKGQKCQWEREIRRKKTGEKWLGEPQSHSWSLLQTPEQIVPCRPWSHHRGAGEKCAEKGAAERIDPLWTGHRAHSLSLCTLHLKEAEESKTGVKPAKRGGSGRKVF